MHLIQFDEASRSDLRIELERSAERMTVREVVPELRRDRKLSGRVDCGCRCSEEYQAQNTLLPIRLFNGHICDSLRMRFNTEIESQYTKLYQRDGDRRRLSTKCLASLESSLGNWEASRGFARKIRRNEKGVTFFACV
jgi:hypothetical protein